MKTPEAVDEISTTTKRFLLSLEPFINSMTWRMKKVKHVLKKNYALSGKKYCMIMHKLQLPSSEVGIRM